MTTPDFDAVCKFLRSLQARAREVEVARKYLEGVRSELFAITHQVLCASHLIEKGEKFDMRQTGKLQKSLEKLDSLRSDLS